MREGTVEGDWKSDQDKKEKKENNGVSLLSGPLTTNVGWWPQTCVQLLILCR